VKCNNSQWLYKRPAVCVGKLGMFTRPHANSCDEQKLHRNFHRGVTAATFCTLHCIRQCRERLLILVIRLLIPVYLIHSLIVNLASEESENEWPWINVQALKHWQHEWRRPTVKHLTYAPLVQMQSFHGVPRCHAVFKHMNYCSCYLCPLMSSQKWIHVSESCCWKFAATFQVWQIFSTDPSNLWWSHRKVYRRKTN